MNTVKKPQDVTSQQLKEAITRLDHTAFQRFPYNYPEAGKADLALVQLLARAYGQDQGLSSVTTNEDGSFELDMTNLHMDGVDFNMDALSLALAYLYEMDIIKPGGCRVAYNGFSHEAEEDAAADDDEEDVAAYVGQYPHEVLTLYELHQDVQFFPQAVVALAAQQNADG
jgi:hypothetical protein